MSRISSPTSVCSSSGNGSGADSDSTVSSVAVTSISPVAQLGVLVARRAAHDLAGDLHAELGAQPVGPLGHLALAEHHLGRAGGVAQVDEDHPAVIAAAGHPPGEGHGLSGVLGAQRAGGVGAHHGS